MAIFGDAVLGAEIDCLKSMKNQHKPRPSEIAIYLVGVADTIFDQAERLAKDCALKPIDNESVDPRAEGESVIDQLHA